MDRPSEVLAAFAFAIAHPSVIRRFQLAILEQSSECERGYHRGYGRHADKPLISRDPLTIYIPFLQSQVSITQAKQIVEEAAASWLEPKEIAA